MVLAAEDSSVFQGCPGEVSSVSHRGLVSLPPPLKKIKIRLSLHLVSGVWCCVSEFEMSSENSWKVWRRAGVVISWWYLRIEPFTKPDL